MLTRYFPFPNYSNSSEFLHQPVHTTGHVRGDVWKCDCNVFEPVNVLTCLLLLYASLTTTVATFTCTACINLSSSNWCLTRARPCCSLRCIHSSMVHTRFDSWTTHIRLEETFLTCAFLYRNIYNIFLYMYNSIHRNFMMITKEHDRNYNLWSNIIKGYVRFQYIGVDRDKTKWSDSGSRYRWRLIKLELVLST